MYNIALREGLFFAPAPSVFITMIPRKSWFPSLHLPLVYLPFSLKNKGEIVEREVLLQKIWDDYGLQASNNNLNQCLSTLRRIIKSMGVEKNIIETIPKVGLRIANDTLIEVIDNIHETVTTEAMPAKEKPKGWRKIKFAYGLITLVIIFTVTTSLHVFHLYGHYSHRHYINNFMELANAHCEAQVSPAQAPCSDLFSPATPY